MNEPGDRIERLATLRKRRQRQRDKEDTKRPYLNSASPQEVTMQLFRQIRLTAFIKRPLHHLSSQSVRRKFDPRKTSWSISQARGTALHTHARGRTYVFVSLVI